MSSSKEQSQVNSTAMRELYSGEGEERTEQGGQIPHTALAPSVFHPIEKTPTEPDTGIQSGPLIQSIRSERHVYSPLSPLFSAEETPTIDGASQGAIRRGRPISKKERENNTIRMRKQRKLIREQKDKIKELIPRSQGHAPPTRDLHLWTEVADHIEDLLGENVRLKRKAGYIAPAENPDIFVADDFQAMVVNGPRYNATTSLSESLQMPYLQWEDPIRSDMGTELPPVAGPSSLATTSETINARAATMTPPPDWSTFWENYNPEPLLTPIPSVQAQQTGLQWPEHVADQLQADLGLEYFNSGPNPVWDPLALEEDYFATLLEQHVQTDAHIPNTLNHEIGLTGPQLQTDGSTEGLSSCSADSGMQDYLFALFAQR